MPAEARQAEDAAGLGVRRAQTDARRRSGYFHHGKIGLGGTATGTYPVAGDIGPAGTRCDSVVGTTGEFIIDVPAKETLPLLERLAQAVSQASGKPYTVPLTPDRIEIFSPGCK
jgi:hypothetical protein